MNTHITQHIDNERVENQINWSSLHTFKVKPLNKFDPFGSTDDQNSSIEMGLNDWSSQANRSEIIPNLITRLLPCPITDVYKPSYG
jgi:hypothetical protein